MITYAHVQSAAQIYVDLAAKLDSLNLTQLAWVAAQPVQIIHSLESIYPGPLTGNITRLLENMRVSVHPRPNVAAAYVAEFVTFARVRDSMGFNLKLWDMHAAVMDPRNKGLVFDLTPEDLNIILDYLFIWRRCSERLFPFLQVITGKYLEGTAAPHPPREGQFVASLIPPPFALAFRVESPSNPRPDRSQVCRKIRGWCIRHAHSFIQKETTVALNALVDFIESSRGRIPYIFEYARSKPTHPYCWLGEMVADASPAVNTWFVAKVCSRMIRAGGHVPNLIRWCQSGERTHIVARYMQLDRDMDYVRAIAIQLDDVTAFSQHAEGINFQRVILKCLRHESINVLTYVLTTLFARVYAPASQSTLLSQVSQSPLLSPPFQIHRYLRGWITNYIQRPEFAVLNTFIQTHFPEMHAEIILRLQRRSHPHII